jgi:acyl dehydratase
VSRAARRDEGGATVTTDQDMQRETGGNVPAPYDLTVDRAMNLRYVEAVEDYHPRYLRGRDGHPPIVQPGLLLNRSNSTRSPSYRQQSDRVGLHAKEQVQFLSPAYLDEPLRIEWSNPSRFERRGRPWSSIDARIVGEGGREILRRTLMAAQTSGAQPVEARRESGGAPAAAESHGGVSEVAEGGDGDIGLVLAGRTKTITLDRLRLFSGPGKNHHTDEDVAKAMGLVAPIASATQFIQHLVELMVDGFGEAWLSGGTLSLNFLKPVYAGYVLTSFGQVLSAAPEGDRLRYEVKVWTETQQGGLVQVGTATSLVPS